MSRNIKWIGLGIAAALSLLGTLRYLWGVRPVRNGESTFLCKRVIVTFDPSAPGEAVTLAVQAVHASIAQYFSAYQSYELALPGPCRVKQVLDAITVLKTQPYVLRAEPDIVGQLD